MSKVSEQRSYDQQMYLVDIIFTYQRPFLFLQILRQVFILGNIVLLSEMWYDLIQSSVIFSTFVILYILFDIQLQIAVDELRCKDLKVMKILHDIKNPVMALMATINDSSLTKEVIQGIANADLEDINEMLDNLRAEFKSRQKIIQKEELREVNTIDFLENLTRSHLRLAKNGNTDFQIEAEKLIPSIIKIPKSSIKRVCNNIISNSLKHTSAGCVNVNLSLPSAAIILDPSQIHMGSNYNNLKQQLMIEVKDNGIGIPKNKLHKIFDVMESDAQKENQDGTGIGLSICNQICSQTDSFIRYKSDVGSKDKSIPNGQNQQSYTIFRLFVPINDVKKDSGMQSASEKEFLDSVLNRKFSKTVHKKLSGSKFQTHNCHEVLLVEDNPSILKKYENYQKKKDIKQNSFLNGEECLEQIKSFECQKCSHFLLMTDKSMPHCDGIQLVTALNKLKLRHQFQKVLISAEEYKNDKGLFDEVFLKPIPVKYLLEIYHKVQDSIK